MTPLKLILGALVAAATVGVGVVAGLGIARLTEVDQDPVAASSDGDDSTKPADHDDSGVVVATEVATKTPAIDVRRVDWESLSYVVEEQGVDTEVTPTTEVDAEMGWGMSGQEFGDLDGDGNEDALVELYNIGPSVRPAAAFVVLATDDEPKGLATRRVQYPVFPSDNLQEVTIEGRRLRLRAEESGVGGSNATPPNDIVAAYELRAGALEEVSRTSTPKPDSIEGRFDAIVDAYLAKDPVELEALIGLESIDGLADPQTWADELSEQGCEGSGLMDLVPCVLTPTGQEDLSVMFEASSGEVLDAWVGDAGTD